MQIVIDVPKYVVGLCCEDNVTAPVDIATLIHAVKVGTPLPKGHGRLIDESDLVPDADYEDGIFYAVSIGVINGTPTIIEADKAESEE